MEGEDGGDQHAEAAGSGYEHAVVVMAESLMTDKLLVVEVAKEAYIAEAMMEEAEMATKTQTVAVGMVGGAGE